MLNFSKPYFEIAVCKALFYFLFFKCSFNLKHKSLALPIYCFPLTLFKKLYIPRKFLSKKNGRSRLENMESLSCKSVIVNTGMGLLG